MTIPHIILILVTGVAAGFLNTVGGGGSLLTMPMLIFLGLPAAAANGTNRVALMVQNIVAIINFRHKGFFNPKLSITLGIPAVLGSIVGAKFAISLPEHLFNKILALVMLIVLVLIITRPEKKFFKTPTGEEEKFSTLRLSMAVLVFFFVGFYGGFIQAGVGFIIIAALTLITGMSLVKINSLKVFVIGIYMLSSLLVFIINGKVNWVLGLTLAIGNAAGAYIGSNFAVAKGDKWIRIVLIVAVLLMSGKLLGLYKFTGW
ncbi:putative membrane protein YfcA [Desulfohalotomaculum tongense]|uniref:sulfite exporter TauE/SafE family protein n=1 Tax=Desulforadius tongensis TaxID=1216062 RepID=UPI001EE5AAA8|nr:sulfite exporter TauE/SafE family protein [Desulforadius tongensis]MBM7854095.1 putative membrane protein YfcA [Desulforadius tongensis]